MRGGEYIECVLQRHIQIDGNDSTFACIDMIEKIKATLQGFIAPLADTDGIGHRNEQNLPLNLAVSIGPIKQIDQMMHDDKAGGFVGMQACLDIGFAAGGLIPVMDNR